MKYIWYSPEKSKYPLYVVYNDKVHKLNMREIYQEIFFKTHIHLHTIKETRVKHQNTEVYKRYWYLLSIKMEL